MFVKVKIDRIELLVIIIFLKISVRESIVFRK